MLTLCLLPVVLSAMLALKPAVTAVTYSYHYVVHYPARPRYYYYYNPVRRYYWGRYDTEAKGYSLLAEADLDLHGAKAWPSELVVEVLVARLAGRSRAARARR